MSDYSVGQRVRLCRPTFLHKGVIVRGNAEVLVVAARDGGTYDVEYRDAEKQPHVLTEIPASDLEVVS